MDIGDHVKTKKEYCGIPKGENGIVLETYVSGPKQVFVEFPNLYRITLISLDLLEETSEIL